MESLLMGEKIDQLGSQGLKIIQNPTKFKFTMDAFLLANFVQVKSSQLVMDLGSGGGVLSLLLAQKAARIMGLEIQPELVAMARRSVALNALTEVITFWEGDLCCLPEELKRNSFDYVISNPPFFPLTRGPASGNAALATARFEVKATLKDVILASQRLVKGNGKVAYIFPTKRFPEMLLTLAKHHLQVQRLRFIYPYQGSLSNLFLVEAAINSKKEPEVLPPLIVHEPSGEYTTEMQKIFASF